MSRTKDTRNEKSSALTRRRALALGAGAAGLLATSSGARAQSYTPSYSSPRTSAPPPAVYPAPRGPRPRIDPVLFWNDAAVQLDALDHSIDAKDARAPGPCCAVRAFGLVHMVMADAAAAVYRPGYDGLCVRGGTNLPQGEFADVFVGAAGARMLEHIYSTPSHRHLIGSQRQRFLRHYDSRALDAWNAGLAFGRDERFTSQWSWTRTRDAALTSLDRAHAVRRGEHDVDPFNPDQKFYGVTWGRMPPLMERLSIASFVPQPPPHQEDRDYLRDWDEVHELGAHRPRGPTSEQVKIGLFWAYCGVRLVGTPARLYNQVLTQIAIADGLSTPEMARLLALCNIAMADAGIVCWEGKYRYKLWRPCIGIPHALHRPDRDWRPFGSPRTNPWQFSLGSDSQRLTALSMLGGGERLGEPAKDVLPYHLACFTPNFPAYPSGHASFGSACFNMLKKVRAERDPTRRDPGAVDDVFVSDELNGISIDNFRNEPRPYSPIHYRRIEQMIEDNNKSRVHLGVHWNFDCHYGSASGAQLAEAIYRSAYPLYR